MREYAINLVGTVALAMLLVSCGGGTSETTPLNPQTGSGALPGVVGNIGGTPVSGHLYGTEPATMDYLAPLGLNDDYAPGIVGGEVAGADSHGTSVVAGPIAPPSGFMPIDLVMMPDGVAPNWNLTKGVFTEGQKIDMWIWYELYSPSMTMDRRWLAGDIGLDFPEVALPHVQGTFKVKLDYAIPFVGAKTNSVFKFDVTGNGLNKVSPNFLFDIVTTPSTTAIYPPSSDGDNSVPGYGAGWAQLAIEDLVSDSDYDFNDFVARMQATEFRNVGGDLMAIKMRIKAIARGAGYDAQWQLNFGAAFPGATAFAKIDQYYANGTRHGNQVLWKSSNGLAIPVFSPTKGALPPPPGSFATNTVAGTKWIDGDYADVMIFFDHPVPAGSYTPMPYSPELRVLPPGGPTYIVTYSVQTDSGWMLGSTPTDGEYDHPLGFIIPDTWAWPLEFQPIWNSYGSFMNWANWVMAPNSANLSDPNTYLVSPAPTTSGSQFGSSPGSAAYWTGTTGQDVFHVATAPSGQRNTSSLISFLNGNGTAAVSSVKGASAANVSLNMFKTTKSYFSGSLPLPTTNINNSYNTSDAYTRLKSYIAGATSTKPVEYRLGAELAVLVLNLERGKVKGNEWVWIPEFSEIRPIDSDPLVTSRSGVIAAANAAFALPTSTSNDAIKLKWLTVCQRINANTYFVKNQPKPEPSPLWFNQTPTGTGYFKRSLFTN